MSDLGVQIIDHLSLLSKNQKSKLKLKIKEIFSDKIYRSIDAKIKFNNQLRNEIIPNIQYANDEIQKYNYAEVSWNPENNLCTVELLFNNQDESKKEEKMKQLLHEKHIMRQSSTKFNNSDEWKEYYKLKNLSRRQDFPSPTDIQQNKQIYEELVKTLPQSPIKKYFEQCIQ